MVEFILFKSTELLFEYYVKTESDKAVIEI